eukprot:2205789-Rhodomonas_salina.5
MHLVDADELRRDRALHQGTASTLRSVSTGHRVRAHWGWETGCVGDRGRDWISSGKIGFVTCWVSVSAVGFHRKPVTRERKGGREGEEEGDGEGRGQTEGEERKRREDFRGRGSRRIAIFWGSDERKGGRDGLQRCAMKSFRGGDLIGCEIVAIRHSAGWHFHQDRPCAALQNSLAIPSRSTST